MAGCCGEACDRLTKLVGRSSRVGNWGCAKAAGCPKPRGRVPAGRLPRIPYDRTPKASRARPLKHHDQACFSAGKVWWCTQSGESLRLLRRRGRHDGIATSCGRNRTQPSSDRFDRGGTLASPDAQEHRATSAPVHESRTSARIRMGRCQRWVPRSSVRRGLRSSPPPQRPRGSHNRRIRYFGDFAKLARCAYNCLQNPLDLLTERIVG